MLHYMIKKGFIDVNKMILESNLKLNLLPDETLLVLTLLDLYKSNQTTLSVNSLAKRNNVTSDTISNSLNGLLNKGYITLDIEYTKSGKAKEVFNLEELIKVLENTFNEEIKNEKIAVSENLIKDIIDLTEKSFNKSLTPYEIDIVLSWVESGETIDKIRKSIDIALSKKITNLKYVDKIILGTKDQTANVDEEQSKVLDDIFRNLK